MSKIRNKLIATLTVFALLFTSMSAVMFAGKNFAKAEGEDATQVEALFQLQDGAASGYLGEAEDGKDYAGLRWETKINKVYYDSLKDQGTLVFGTLIAPSSYKTDLDFSKLSYDEIENEWYITENGMYVSNIVDDKAEATLSAFASDESGEYVMRSAIRYEEFSEEGVNIKDGYDTELVAIAYVKILDGEGNVIDVKYSEADTMRSLRNSVAYNLAAGNFSEADAASLKQFAVAEDKTYAKLDGDVLYSVNNEAYREKIVDFGDKLAGKNAEFALNSKSLVADYNKDLGVVTLSDEVFAELGQGVHYLTAFCEDGNVYYAEILKATTISTAEELVVFRTIDLDIQAPGNSSSPSNNLADVKTFDGYYVLTNNIDASEINTIGCFNNANDRSSLLARLVYDGAHLYEDSDNGKLAMTKGLTGTFDGRGYSINNLRTPRGGLFGFISGTIKNVAFDNINPQYRYYNSATNKGSFGGPSILAIRVFSTAKLENVYLTSTESHNTRIFNYVTHTAEFKNCYFKSYSNLALASAVNYSTTAADNGGLYMSSNVYSNFSNVVIVSSQGLGSINESSRGHATKDANSKFNLTSTTDVDKIYLISNETIKHFKDLDDMVTMYNTAYPYTNAEVWNIEVNVSAKSVINSFENRSGFIVVDGKIGWDSLSQVYLDGELLSVSELELNVGESAEITVKNIFDIATPDFEIISSSDAVSISNGIITAVKPGNPTISVISKDAVLAQLKINVPKYVVDNTEDAIIVDADGEEFTLPGEYPADKISVNVEGVTASLVDGVLTLEGAEVTTNASTGAVTPTEYTITIETLDTIYTYKVKYITAYIKDAEEFVSTFALAKGDLTSASTLDDLTTFDGYYMLANNIDFAGCDMPTEAFTLTGYIANKKVGMSGTFDGQGYTIYNLVAPEGGVFGVVSGKLMNVAFINCDTTKSGIIAKYSTSQASFTNVYVKYNGGYVGSKYLFVNYPNYNVVLKDCYFEGNLRLYYASTNGAAGVALGLSNTAHTAIVITKHILGVRSTATAYHVEGNTAGSTSSTAYYNDTTTQGTNIQLNCGGALYRYEDVQKLSDMYTNKDSLYTDKTGAVQTLVGKFSSNKYYSVGSTGKVAWASDTASYKVYLDDTTVVENNTIRIESSTDTVLSIKNIADVVINDYTYALSNNDGVVELDGAKLIAIKRGTATLSIMKGEEVWRTIDVVVINPITDKTSETPIILDSFGEKVTVIDGTIIGAFVDGGTATVTDGNVVALSFEDEKAAANKEYVVSLETETNTILYKAHYYTSYISTPGELVDTFKLAKGDSEEATSFDELETFDGYYKLANNIDFAGCDMPTETFTYHANRSNTHGAKMYDIINTIGLTGIFDGDGYTIYNLSLPQGGLFGVVNGTVQNVALINVDMATKTGVFGKYANTLAVFNNIYIEYNNTTDYEKAFLAYYFDNYADFTNCYFKGNIPVTGFTVNGGTATYNYYSNANTAIVVSSLFVTRRSNNDFRCIYGTPAGSISSTISGYTADTHGTGKIYRYPNLTTMTNVYSDTEGAYTQTANLKTLVNSWNNTYFDIDMTSGRIFWKTDFTSYQLLADNDVLEEKKIALDTANTDKIEKGFSVKNAIGEVIPNEGITYELIGDAVTLEGNKITARKIGTSTIVVKMRNTVMYTCEVTVTKPIIEFDKSVTLELNTPTEITLDGIDVINAFVLAEGFDVKFEDGKVIMTDCVPVTTFDLYLEDNLNAYKISAFCYSAIIETAEEFVEVFGLKQDVSSFADLPNYDGYYVLANNIDLSDVEFKYGYTETAITKDIAGHGLTGTFDGQGYTISNLVAPEGGLFPAIHGTIKNVAFINADVKVKVYSRTQNFVEPGGKNYTVNGQNDNQYVVTEREPARDKDGQLSYSSTTSSSGILSKYLGKATLENIYISYGATTPVEFLNGADSSNYTHRLNKAALAVVADSQAKLFNVYFECAKGDDDDTPADENIRLAIRSENYEESGRRHIYFQNANNKVILVTKSAIEARGSSTRYGATGHVAGSTKESFIDIFNVVAPDSAGINNGNDLGINLAGTFYRYVSVEEMSGIYQDAEDSRSAYLKTLLATYDSNYFTVDSTTGVITWNTNVNG